MGYMYVGVLGGVGMYGVCGGLGWIGDRTCTGKEFQVKDPLRRHISLHQWIFFARNYMYITCFCNLPIS